MTVFEKLKEIITKEINVSADKITLEASIKDDLGADSIDAVNIIIDIEDEFGIVVDDTKAEEIVTVGDLVAYVEEMTK